MQLSMLIFDLLRMIGIGGFRCELHVVRSLDELRSYPRGSSERPLVGREEVTQTFSCGVTSASCRDLLVRGELECRDQRWMRSKWEQSNPPLEQEMSYWHSCNDVRKFSLFFLFSLSILT